MSSIAPLTALVVTKEESLGKRTVEILSEEHGYQCRLVLVGAWKDFVKVAKELSLASFDLIVGQQRMSPYSARDLLLEVREKSPGISSPVACLAFDASNRNSFIRSGGAAFEPVEPSYNGLQKNISELLRQVTEFTDGRRGTKDAAYRLIDACRDERTFHKLGKAIFDQLGYRGTRLLHGPWERGCDILCWEVNKLGRKEHLGIQMKCGDIDDSSGKRGITELRNQALKALNSPILVDDEERRLDKFVVMASGMIKPSARVMLVEFLRGNHHYRRTFFLDREEIAELLVRSCQSLLGRSDFVLE